jgi:hypothetical protein
MQRFRSTALAGVLAVAGCSEPSSPEQEGPVLARKVKPIAAVEFRKARLQPDGELIVSLRLRCASGYQVLEEPFTVTQGDVTGSGFSGGTCDDHWDRRTVRVFLDNPDRPGFQPGDTRVRGQFTFENLATGDLVALVAEETFTLR